MATALKLQTAALPRPVTRRAAGVTLSSSLSVATLLPHGIDLRGVGKRSLRRIDFLKGKADVTVFGMK